MASFAEGFLDQPVRVRMLFRLWSLAYDSALFQAPFFSRVHRRILREAASLDPRTILDVGCGTGELLAKLARRWPSSRLAGLDLTPEMLSRARPKLAGANATLVQGSVLDLPFEAGAFDLVVNAISSHYYLDFDRAAEELARVTRPGGTLLMVSMTNGPLGWVPGPWRDEVELWSSAYRSPRAQRAQLEQAGFDVVTVERIVAPAALYVGRRRRA